MEESKSGFKPIHIAWIGIGLFVGVLAIRWGVKSLISVFNPEIKDRETLRSSRRQIVSSELSYSKAEYNAMADRLFNAMDGIQVSAYKTVKPIIESMKTSSDWYALVDAFGIRECTSWYSSWKGNLVTWLQDEISSSDLNEIKIILNKIGVSF